MPVYEYICDNCGHKFEALRSINESTSVNCKKCNTSARRIYASVPFIFGGTRWVGEVKPQETTTNKDKSNNTKTEATKI
ncbi:MAG: zinc ribbon domain-containing protein [Dehalococcoidia bacterium]|nr:MAG: zinc ribbon domain-containing protein [Dehalococcoidia bacterium]